jgi:hypothetical protein
MRDPYFGGYGAYLTPEEVSPGKGWKVFSGGDGGSACGIDLDGVTHCSQLLLPPEVLPGAPTFVDLALGPFHGCGIVEGGAAYCWGTNTGGVLGDGTTTDSAVPIPVRGELRFAQISAESSDHTCGVTTTGSLFCWGSNLSGQLGADELVYPYTSSVPLRVRGSH